MFCALALTLQVAAPPAVWEERLAFTGEGSQAVTSFRFNEDGSRLAVFTHDGEKRHLFLDGEAVDKGHEFYAGPVFSPDGQHVAWAGGDRKGKKEKWTVMLDGKKLGSHDWAGQLTVTDSGTVAYWAGKGVKIGKSGWYEGGKYTLMLGKSKKGDSKQAPERPPLVSPTGKLLAYQSLEQGYLVFLGKEEHGPFLWISGLTASADGEHVAWTASAMGEMSAGGVSFGPLGGSSGSAPTVKYLGQCFLDGELISSDKEEACASPVLNQDGKRLAYIAQREGKVTLVFRGQAWKVRSGEASSPVISPDGKRVAVVLNDGSATATAGMPMLDTRWLDGLDQASIDATGALVLRKPDGECHLYVDDQKSLGPFPRAVLPVWSADSKQLALRVQDDAGWKMVVGETVSESYEELGAPVFSADGSQLAFGARRGQEVWWKVLELPQE